MPAPVPQPDQIAYPVIKHYPGHSVDPSITDLQNLSHSLPVAPTGPPPSFGTREEWISSLPSWRRSKPRRVWEEDNRTAEERLSTYFQQGLAAAVNASAIKGSRAQACIPPGFSSFVTDIFHPPSSPLAADHRQELHNRLDGDADDEMSSDSSISGHSSISSESRWSATSPMLNEDDIIIEQRSQPDLSPSRHVVETRNSRKDGAFSPFMEYESPIIPEQNSSSPVGPVTPFAEFVDRMAAAAYDGLESYGTTDKASGYYGFQEHQGLVIEEPKEPALPEPVVTPTATEGYKKLAEPISEWVANYVWKVCTTGMSLPTAYSCHPSVVRDVSPPPSYLAGAIHSLLLSTLLQPSAIFLAVWYIVRLPIYFDAVGIDTGNTKEMKFRREFLGQRNNSADASKMESAAPFRLILLGCMLANKWLDDHTFSNKTWHTISNVPIQDLNRLESLALDLFQHNLIVTPMAWAQWLSHVQQYHLSLASPIHTQPISRPSNDPHLIVRKAIDELVNAPTCCNSCDRVFCGKVSMVPVFLGVDERRKENLAKAQAAFTMQEINLDEDGPLREEYLPRRRISAGLIHGAESSLPYHFPGGDTSRATAIHSSLPRLGKDVALPPPARWSPAADEPILRDRNRPAPQYVAVQPIVTYPPPDNALRYWGSSASGKGLTEHGFASQQPLYPDENLYCFAPRMRSLGQTSGRENMQPYNYSRQPQALYVANGTNAAAFAIAKGRTYESRQAVSWNQGHAFVPHPVQAYPAVQYPTTWLGA